MENQLLTDSETLPSEDVFKEAFGTWYPVFREFTRTIDSEDFQLSTQWRYYKDGKAWLCKICSKKKTVAWLSAWADGFKLGFYFTEKTGTGIQALDIDEGLKRDYASGKPIGKLKPLVVKVASKAQLPAVYTLMKYKVGRL